MPYSSPPPEWLPDLAEAAAGQQLNRHGYTELVSRMAEMRERLDQVPETDEYAIFAKWFLADPRKRRPCPDPKSVKLYLQPRQRSLNHTEPPRGR